MIYGSWDRVWQTEIDNYGSFFAFYLLPLKTRKIRIMKKMKKYWCRYHHFPHVYQKPQSNEIRFLRYGMRLTETFVISGHFSPFYPLTTREVKILKKWKMHLDMSSFNISEAKITIIWCMVPEQFLPF